MDADSSGITRLSRLSVSGASTTETTHTVVDGARESRSFKHCSLLTLPVELRLRILSELLQCPSPLCLTPIVQDRDPEDSDSRDEEVIWAPSWRLSAQVLAVCKQLNYEGSPILYGNQVCMHFCERSVTILDIHMAEEIMCNLFSDINHDEVVPKSVKKRGENTDTALCRCSSLREHVTNRMSALKRFKSLICTIDGGPPPQNTKACLILRAAGAHYFDRITIKNNFTNKTSQNRPTRWYSGPSWLRYLRCREVVFDIQSKHHDPPWAHQITQILKSRDPPPNLLNLLLSMQDVSGDIFEDDADTLTEVLGKNNWKSAMGREMNYLYQADGQQYEDECVKILDRVEGRLQEQLARVQRARGAISNLYV